MWQNSHIVELIIRKTRNITAIGIVIVYSKLVFFVAVKLNTVTLLRELFCHIDVKSQVSSQSVSRVKPLAILATVDLRPKPVSTAPTPAAESQVTVSDDVPNTEQASFSVC